MFQRTPYTRKSLQKQKDLRHTMRHQRGGVVQSLSSIQFSEGERKSVWKDSLTDFPSLFTVSGPIQLNEYLTFVMKQDEIFQIALKHIQTTANISSEQDLVAKITDGTYTQEEKERIALYIKGYIGDVVSFITMDNAVNTSKSIVTAWKRVMDEGNLMKLLANPKRVENIFIQAIAAVFFILKNDSETLNILRRSMPNRAAFTELASQLAEKYSGYANALSYTLTNGPIRGSFFARQELNVKDNYKEERPFESIIKEGRGPSMQPELPCKGFWCEFIYRCVQDQTIFFGSDWSVLSASIFKVYKENTGDLMSAVLSSIKHANTRRSISPLEKSKFTQEQLATPLLNTETTLQDILQQMSFDAFQYVIHLVYILEKQTPEMEKEQEIMRSS